MITFQYYIIEIATNNIIIYIADISQNKQNLKIYLKNGNILINLKSNSIYKVLYFKKIVKTKNLIFV